MVHMNESRINKRVFIWRDRKAERGCKNHNLYIKENFRKLANERLSDTKGVFSRDTLIYDIVENMTGNLDWHNAISNESGKSGT